MTNNAQAEMVGRLKGGKCPACQGWGEVAYFGEMVGCKCRGQYEAPISMEARREAVAEIERMAGEIAALREALAPFARAEHIVASCDDRIRCTLTYPIDATETFTLGSLQAARQALGESQ